MTKFLEPGGDSTFDFSLWSSIKASAAIVTDFVHGSHLKSIKCTGALGDAVDISGATAGGAGRFSFYVYIAILPSTGGVVHLAGLADTAFFTGTDIVHIDITSGGVLKLTNDSAGQLGSNGATLSTGTWYRLTLVWKITSTTVYDINLFKDGVSTITAHNSTALATTTGNHLTFSALAFQSGSQQQSLRFSDIYVDDSNSLLDIATDVWVTAKRPNANGTTNNFTTQIGAGGSGYGTGHSPQVNERPLSTTNGWSMVGAGSAITEEYSVEGASIGDINISAATLIDYVGWVYAKALASETAQIIVGGTSSNIALTTTITAFMTAKGSGSYPGGGTDIGIITATNLTTVSLYECGLIFAYTPGTSLRRLPALGVGG